MIDFTGLNIILIRTNRGLEERIIRNGDWIGEWKETPVDQIAEQFRNMKPGQVWMMKESK